MNASVDPHEPDPARFDRPDEPAGWPADDEPGPDDDDLREAERLGAAVAAGPAGPAAPVSDARLAAWLDAVVEHDERALTALYDATVHRVLGFVRRIVRSEALAEEVVEDTYFQVWRQAVRFDPARGHAMTWILAMARSRAIDALRREARFAHESIDADGAPEIDGEVPAADELLDIARHHADLYRALELLGAQPRQLVSLAFLRGLSHEEISEQMCLPLGTVKSQIRRALITLREVLGARSPFTLATPAA